MISFVINRASLRQFFASVLLYLIGCLVSVLVAMAIGDIWLLALYMSGGAAALLTWRRMRWPDEWARYLSFGAVLLLMCALNRLFYAADYLLPGARFDEWPFFANAPEVAVFKGEVITVLGTLFTVLSWSLAGGMHMSPSVLMDRRHASVPVLVVIYLMSLIGMAASQWSPLAAAKFGELLPTLLGLGIVSAFLLPMVKFGSGSARLAAVSVLSAPFVILAAGTGMKENMILAVLPAALLAWRAFRHPVLRAGMLLAGLLALAILTSYVNFFRTEVWQGDSDAATGFVVQNFVDEVQKVGVGESVAKGLEGFVGRSNASVHRGWAVSIADEQQFYPRLVFSPMVYVFIPRMLWPEKPLIRQGWEYSGVVFGQQYITWSESSTAAGFYTSLYLGYGWLAFGFGAVLVGVLLAGMTKMAQRFGGAFAAGLYIFAMLPFMLRLDETWAVGALSGPVITLAYVLAIVGFARMLAVVMLPLRRSGAGVR